ncbi:MAG: biotin--[acetyl-CoA-carboxylase] ligase [Psychrobacillus sp.]
MSITIKERIISRLLAANGDPISGQTLAEELEISRTMVWKYLKGLEEMGYEIEAIKKKGYILKHMPDTLASERISLHLETKELGRNILYYPVCDSTQTIATNKAREGSPHGTLVVSEEQTAGRGRLDRSWESSAGKGIWMSMILRPNISPQFAAQFTLVAAVAIARAIEDTTTCVPSIKWPNDLLINGKKVTGILTELQSDMDRVQAIIIGIGINVNQTSESFEGALESIATSLKLETGEDVNRALLTSKVLYYLEKYSDMYITLGFEPIKLIWESYNCTIGNRIRATTLRDTIEGVAIGMTNDGALQLQLDNGEIKGIYSADIDLLKI